MEWFGLPAVFRLILLEFQPLFFFSSYLAISPRVYGSN